MRLRDLDAAFHNTLIWHRPGEKGLRFPTTVQQVRRFPNSLRERRGDPPAVLFQVKLAIRSSLVRCCALGTFDSLWPSINLVIHLRSLAPASEVTK